RLRHAEELYADLARTFDREEAPGTAPVEEEVGGWEVVQHARARALGPAHCIGEQTVRDARRSRVRRIVEVERGTFGRVEINERRAVRTGERDRGRVVRVARIGQEDRLTAFDRDERELHQRRLRAGDDGDLA